MKDDVRKQVEEEEYTYSDMLTMRPPKSELEAAVARPKRAALPHGLPMWNKKPLNAKLPLMQGPKGPIHFTRGKLGEHLWKGSPDSEFQLKDPHNHEVRFDYEPSHDRHLRAWLHQPHVLKTLRDQNLITPGLQVKCSVQQYNNFRQYLYNIYSDALRSEAQRRENHNLERLMLKRAQENAAKDASKLKKIEDSKSKRMSNLKKIEILEIERLEKCKKRLQRVIDLAASAEERKEAELELRKQRIEAFDERIRSRIDAANRIERRNKIKAMKAWHKADVEKKKQFEKRKEQRELKHKREAEERWKRKVKEQKKQIAKEEYLQQLRKRAMEKHRQMYLRAMEKGWTKFEDELNMRKCQATLSKVKASKRQKSIKQIMKSVSDAYSLRKSLLLLSQDEDTMETLTERIQQTLKEIRYDLEPYIVIAHAKCRLERQENVPLPVSGAIKFLLEQAIVEYTVGKLSVIVSEMAKKVLSTIDELKTSAGTETRSISLKMSSLSGIPREKSVSSGKTARLSGVEEIPLFKNSEELVLEVDNLRTTLGRAPTPMPSIATLTEVLFKEPDEEEFEEELLGEFPFIEQRQLIMSITEISQRIFHMIPSRVRAVAESRSYDRISTASSEHGESLGESKPVSKICSLLLFEEDVLDHVLTRVVDRMILGFMKDIDISPSYLRLKIRQNQGKK